MGQTNQERFRLGRSSGSGPGTPSPSLRVGPSYRGALRSMASGSERKGQEAS